MRSVRPWLWGDVRIWQGIDAYYEALAASPFSTVQSSSSGGDRSTDSRAAAGAGTGSQKSANGSGDGGGGDGDSGGGGGGGGSSLLDTGHQLDIPRPIIGLSSDSGRQLSAEQPITRGSSGDTNGHVIELLQSEVTKWRSTRRRSLAAAMARVGLPPHAVASLLAGT